MKHAAPDRHDSNFRIRHSIVFGPLTIAASVVVMWLLYQLGASELVSGAVLAISIAVVFTRWRFFSVLLPIAVFAPLLISNLELRVPNPEPEGYPLLRWEAILLAVASLLMLSFSQRLHACLQYKQVGRLVTDRFNYRPSTTGPEPKFALGLREISSVVLLLAAGLIGAWFALPLNQVLAPNLELRLIGEAFLGIRILLVATLALWLTRTALDYLRTMLDRDGDLAAMRLRTELWRWTGSEQRMIARQVKKNDAWK